jgi:SET domain-containing protein
VQRLVVSALAVDYSTIAGDIAENRRYRQTMPSSHYRIGRAFTGLGMFATKPLRRRDYIATYRGKVITNEESEEREARGASYMFALGKKHTIDGSPRYNVARYINHSCRPNAEPVGRNGGIVIIASQKIEPGEEITYDYGKDYFAWFVEAGGCKCAWCREKKARKRRKARMLRAEAARKSKKIPARKKSKKARAKK